MMKLKLFLFLNLIFLSHASSAIFEPHLKWKKNSVRVCWATPQVYNVPSIVSSVFPKSSLKPISKAWKNFAESVVRREYTLKETHIEFIGWNDCEKDNNYDVMIFTTYSSLNSKQKRGGISSVARGFEVNTVFDKHLKRNKKGFFVPMNKYKPFIVLNLIETSLEEKKFHISMTNLFELNVLHEFGHLAGLRHEHVNPDAKEDIACKGMNMGEPLLNSAVIGTSYDPNSIMNYCFLKSLYQTGLKFTFEKNLEEKVLKEENTIYALPDLFTIEDDSMFCAMGKNSYEVSIQLSHKDKQSLRCLYSLNPFDILDYSNCESL